MLLNPMPVEELTLVRYFLHCRVQRASALMFLARSVYSSSSNENGSLDSHFILAETRRELILVYY